MLAISLANPCFSSVAALNARPQQREFVDFETRELDEQLDAREPIFGFLKKAAKKVAGLVLREDANGEYYVAREYDDDIDAREPIFGFLGKAAKKVAGLVLREDENDFVLRETPEFDELD